MLGAVVPWAGVALLCASVSQGSRVGRQSLDESSAGRFSPVRAFIPPLGLAQRGGLHGVASPLARPSVPQARRPASWLGAGSFSSEPPATTIEEEEAQDEAGVAGHEDDWVSRAFNADTESDDNTGRAGGLPGVQESNVPVAEEDDFYTHDAWRDESDVDAGVLGEAEAEESPGDVEAQGEAGAQAEAPAHRELIVLERVTAKGAWNGKPGPREINLPQTWVERFVPDSVRLHDEQATLSEREILAAGTARLAADPSRIVQFTTFRADTPESYRELLAAEILSQDALVPVLIDTVTLPTMTFLLREPCTKSLSSVISAQALADDEDDDTARTFVPLQVAVPLMIDMLRALIIMEGGGVVHQELSEHNIFVREEGEQLVMFTEFFNSHISDSLLDGMYFLPDHDGSRGSAWRQPPEVQGERLYIPQGNVWQLGLVFARMLAGGDLWTIRAAREALPDKEFDDTTWEGRDAIREALRDIRIVPRGDKSYKRLRIKFRPLMIMVEGMLENDATKRLTAKEALEALLLFAHEQGFGMPKIPTPEAETEAWRQIWEESDVL